MKSLLTVFLFVFGMCISSFSQKAGTISISAGTGFSVFLTSMKSGLNIALKELDLPKINSTPMFVSSLNFGLNEHVKLGLGYTQNNFDWKDRFVKNLPDSSAHIYDTVKVDARVDLSRKNYALKGLYVFNPDNKLSVYLGVRLGMSVWKIDVEGDYEFGETDFSLPGNVFNFQLYIGGDWYFSDPVGVNFEVGIGNAPYLVSVGFCGRINYN